MERALKKPLHPPFIPLIFPVKDCIVSIIGQHLSNYYLIDFFLLGVFIHYSPNPMDQFSKVNNLKKSGTQGNIVNPTN
jgi:hypothetical protein